MLFAKNLNRSTHPSKVIEMPSGACKAGRLNPIFPDDDEPRAARRRNNTAKNRSGRMGAATVELALVVPFILFIIFGSVEFARMMMVKQALTNAAREGCRHATLATIRDHDDAEDVVRDLLAGSIGNDQETCVQVTITPAFHRSPASGTEIVTLVEVACADISWLPASLFAGAKVRGVASMNRE